MSSGDQTPMRSTVQKKAAFAAGRDILLDTISRWQLQPDGKAFRSNSSWLQPVLYHNIPAMLKIAVEAEEKPGGILMAWWNGEGAARVLKHEDDILLLENLQGKKSLATMARNGGDDEASRIICSVAAKLHTARNTPPPATLIPLGTWFRELAPAAAKYGGVLQAASCIADKLLTSEQDMTVLHGDLHHGNVLDGGNRGWLTIDPKGLKGERGFDFANIFCNPDLATATAPGRLARQINVVSTAAGLAPKRLLEWVLAYAGLSAAWSLSDGDDPAIALRVAEAARTQLSY